MNEFEKLPSEIRTKLMTFLAEIDGEIQVVDMEGLVKFIADHGGQYPVLFGLVQINGDAVVEHYERTGELPPGVKLIRKTPLEGENVTKLEILHGPIPPKP